MLSAVSQQIQTIQVWTRGQRYDHSFQLFLQIIYNKFIKTSVVIKLCIS
jgi:hypothetical protein